MGLNYGDILVEKNPNADEDDKETKGNVSGLTAINIQDLFAEDFEDYDF